MSALISGMVIRMLIKDISLHSNMSPDCEQDPKIPPYIITYPSTNWLIDIFSPLESEESQTQQSTLLNFFSFGKFRL